MTEKEKLKNLSDGVSSSGIAVEKAKQLFVVAEKKVQAITSLMMIESDFVFNKDSSELRCDFLILEASKKLMEDQFSLATKGMENAALSLVELDLAVSLGDKSIRDQATKDLRHNVALAWSRLEEITVLVEMITDKTGDVI